MSRANARQRSGRPPPFPRCVGWRPRACLPLLRRLRGGLGARRDRQARSHWASSRALKPEPRRDSPRTTTSDARALWRGAIPTPGTVAETYLRARGFVQAPPASIRFLSSYPYSTRERFPCLIAAVQAPSCEIVAVQLTFLDPSGARKAEVAEPRRCIGPLGAGALRLASPVAHLGLAEGFETAWAAMLLHGLPVWAVLGAKRYLKVSLPEAVQRVTIFADNDAPGLSHAEEFRRGASRSRGRDRDARKILRRFRDAVAEARSGSRGTRIVLITNIIV